jgi:hypothetical protein
MSVTTPDRLHLHMLIYRRCVRQRLPHKAARSWSRNAAVAALVAPWTAAWTLVVVALGSSGPAAALLLGLHAVAYVAVYVRLLRGYWCILPGAGVKRLARAARARSPWATRVER